MQASNFALSGLADWWDKQKADSEKILTEWVQDNPQWWAVAVAASVQTSMDLGSGFVDVLRFGEGAAQGGFKGYGKDALRLLVLLGPLGRAGGAASRFLTPLFRAGNLRLAVSIRGVSGPCTFQAVTNAVNITRGAKTGNQLFVTVADMAKAVGRQLSKLKEVSPGKLKLGAWIEELVPFLRNAGIRIKELKGLKSIDQIVDLARFETGPVIFAIRTTVRTAAGTTREILHSVIAMRMPTGVVKFADYGGKYFDTLEQLVSRWGTPISDIELAQKGVSGVILDAAELTGEWATKLSDGAVLVMEGLAAIETNENGVEMGVPAVVVASTAPSVDDPASAEVVKGAFDAYKTRANGKKVIRLPEMVITAGRRTAPRPDWLTGVQYRLNASGFGCGRVDGIMGPLTRKAVIAFQKAYPPLATDGIPGPQTQAKLVEVCGY
jgi:hypothetical protein